jgi:hypothetical protein
MAQPTFGKNDPYIIHALEYGTIQVDPEVGAVFSYGLNVCKLDKQSGYVRAAIPGATVGAHRVVFIAKHGPIVPGMVINHRNKVRHDNRIRNLEMVTHGENIAHAFGTVYYERIRDEDLEAVDADWLANVIELVERGDATYEDIAALRPEPRGPIGSPEFTMWHDDQKVGHALHGRR